MKARGTVKVNEKFTLKDVGLVEHLKYNLLSVSQLLDVGLEVRFKKNASCVLDSNGSLVCATSSIGRVFQADFVVSPSSHKCLVAQSSSEP